MAGSERIHNKNCYAYLNALIIPEPVLNRIGAISPHLAEGLVKAHGNEYDPEFAYADLYTQFFKVTENEVAPSLAARRQEILHELALIAGAKQYLTSNPNDDSILGKQANARAKPEHEQALTNELESLEAFIFSIYDNDNGILPATYETIQHIPAGQTPSERDIQSRIATFVRDRGPTINREAISPAQAGSAYGRFSAMMASDFKPQHTTSLATVRKYTHSTNASTTEYRFGTQAQRHNGNARVSPLFKLWLQVQDRAHLPQEVGKTRITHLYINNLGLDRNDMEGKKERDLTTVLHELENELSEDGHFNVAVITLPADKGLMSRSEFKNTKPEYDYGSVNQEFLQIAQQDPAATRKIKDFYISDKVRALVFQDSDGVYSKAIEKQQIQTLLDKSFKALGVNKDEPLSGAQRQAVWFHFIKYELTNFIINKLNPQSMNFSCKDAIDRGGVSSAYFNLMDSIQNKQPMTREEFDQALHAAPTMVKARGMNHHTKLIWNAVNGYINANYAALKNDHQQTWLIEWRDLNCPHARVPELLNIRIEQTKNELAQITPANAAETQALRNGQALLEKIQHQSDMGVSGKRLLLEAVTRTPDVILNPTDKENNERYKAIADKLDIKYPKLHIIAGVMKTLVAIALFIPSFGRTKELLQKGIATARAGWHGETRNEIQKSMKEQVKEARDDAISRDTNANVDEATPIEPTQPKN